MKTLFFSDVHGVATAFRAFLRELEREAPDQVVFLGDLLTLGPSPLEVAELYSRHNFPGVRGNHDEFLLDQSLARTYTSHPAVLDSIDWTRSEVGPGLGVVAQLGGPWRVDLGRGRVALCYHGTPDSSTAVVRKEDARTQLGPALAEGDTLGIGGHIHRPYGFRGPGPRLWNTGSCGMPFSGVLVGGLPGLVPRIDWVTVVSGARLSIRSHSRVLDRETLRNELKSSRNPLAAPTLAQYGL